LNDARWSSPQARAKGLRDLGLAQLGSKGVVSDQEFARLMAEKTIRVILPKLFRLVMANDKDVMAAVDRCEREGTGEAATAEAAAWAGDEFLILSASLALETLRELNSPGIALLAAKEGH
jgi:hypothetical protein